MPKLTKWTWFCLFIVGGTWLYWTVDAIRATIETPAYTYGPPAYHIALMSLGGLLWGIVLGVVALSVGAVAVGLRARTDVSNDEKKQDFPSDD
jgi:hypothetical protein